MSDTEQQTVETPASPAPAPAAEPATPETFDQTLERVSRAATAKIERGADGRFTPKAGATDATPKVEIPGGPQAAAPEPALPAIDAPLSLPDDVKALWPSLPRAAQENWSKRESESHKKITADGERLKSLERFEEALAGSREFLTQHNIPSHEYARRLADADRQLRERPYEALNWIAQSYGIDLGRLHNPGSQPEQSNALIRKITELESRLAAREQADSDARLGQAMDRIEAFKKDKPYFDDTAGLMDKLIRSGAAKELEDAYDMAIHASPEIRAKREAEATKAAEKKAAEDAKAKAEKDAKLAALGKRPGSTPTAPIKGKTMWDTMDRVAADIRARP